MIIRVTAADYAKAAAIERKLEAGEAVYEDAYNDPVALALNRQTGGFWAVCRTFADQPNTRCRAGRVWVKFPPIVEQMMSRWEQGDRRMPEYSFEIDYRKGDRTLTPWPSRSGE